MPPLLQYRVLQVEGERVTVDTTYQCAECGKLCQGVMRFLVSDDFATYIDFFCSAGCYDSAKKGRRERRSRKSA